MVCTDSMNLYVVSYCLLLSRWSWSDEVAQSRCVSSPVALCPRTIDEESLGKISSLIISPKPFSLLMLVFALKST